LTNSVLKGIEHWLDQVGGKLAASPVELDPGDDDEGGQDLPPGTSIDAPFNPPEIAEACAPLPARKPRIKIKIRRS